MPRIILVTGHICSGKTSLSKESIFDSYVKIDIAKIYLQNKNLCYDQNLFLNKVYNDLKTSVFNNLFKMNNVYIELIGNELFFSHFRELLFKSSFKLIEIELKKNNLKDSITDLRKRNSDLSLEEQEAEEHILRSTYDRRFNDDAEHFVSFSNGIFEKERLLKIIMEGNQYVD